MPDSLRSAVAALDRRIANAANDSKRHRGAPIFQESPLGTRKSDHYVASRIAYFVHRRVAKASLNFGSDFREAFP